MSEEDDTTPDPSQPPLEAFRMEKFDFSTADQYTASTVWFNRYETDIFWRFLNLREHVQKLYHDLAHLIKGNPVDFRRNEKTGWMEVYHFLDDPGLRITLMTSLSFPSSIRWRWHVAGFRDDQNALINRFYQWRWKARTNFGLYREDRILRAVTKFLLNLPHGMFYLYRPDPDNHSIVLTIGWKDPKNPDMINLMIQDSRRVLF